MTAIPFALVSVDDHTRILAYGLDIDLPSGRDIITYRRDPDGRNQFAVHQSVESAQRLYNTITPVDLVWEPGCCHGLCLTGDGKSSDKGVHAGGPRS